MPQGRYGMGQLFQSASQALGIVDQASGGRLGSITRQLGFGDGRPGGLGDRLSEQVAGETDEQRRRRMREQQTGSLMPGSAAFDLFGGMGGLQY